MHFTYTNTVLKANLGCVFNLEELSRSLANVSYNKHKFSALVWRHKKIEGCILINKSGVCIQNGCPNVARGKKSVRRFARLLQKHGYDVNLKYIQVITQSALVDMQQRLDFNILNDYMGATYNPDIFNASCFYKHRTHFTCFHTGKIVLTGLNARNIQAIVLPTLLELAALHN